MLPWLRDWHANPHSDHFHGRRAHAAVEEARTSVATLIGADPEEIVFTSGATESVNLALQGYLRGYAGSGRLVHSSIEHACVREVGRALKSEGVDVQVVPVDRTGMVRQVDLQGALSLRVTDRTLVSLIHANNEIGTVQPIGSLSRTARDAGALIHLDASQSAGWLPMEEMAQDVDLLTLSSHKLGGPAGIAALFIATGVERMIRPLVFGGGQESGLRSGTVAPFLAVGFGEACRLIRLKRDAFFARAKAAADAFIASLGAGDVEFELIGHPTDRLPGLCSIRFVGVPAVELLGRLNRVLSASSSSACSSGQVRASPVLRALALSEEEAMEVIRFGFGCGLDNFEASSLATAVSEAVLSIVKR